MTPYRSRSGKQSGVAAYAIGEDYIRVRFTSGRVYTYSYRSAGRGAVEAMKSLALASRGLSTYISQNRPGFE